jgi:predicted nucleotidyltransferase
MRLLNKEIDIIKTVIRQFFGDGARVMLFGSRVDDLQRGGDIDLYVLPENTSAQWQQTMKALSMLKVLLGDQKIDLVIAQDAQRLIEQEALTSGVLL